MHSLSKFARMGTNKVFTRTKSENIVPLSSLSLEVAMRRTAGFAALLVSAGVLAGSVHMPQPAARTIPVEPAVTVAAPAEATTQQRRESGDSVASKPAVWRQHDWPRDDEPRSRYRPRSSYTDRWTDRGPDRWDYGRNQRAWPNPYGQRSWNGASPRTYGWSSPGAWQRPWYGPRREAQSYAWGRGAWPRDRQGYPLANGYDGRRWVGAPRREVQPYGERYR